MLFALKYIDSESNMSIESTLGNETWLRQNETRVKALFPNTFTPINELNGVAIGQQLRLLTIDWKTEKEFENIMVFFEKLGFLIRQGNKIKTNDTSIFRAC